MHLSQQPVPRDEEGRQDRLLMMNGCQRRMALNTRVPRMMQLMVMVMVMMTWIQSSSRMKLAWHQMSCQSGNGVEGQTGDVQWL